MDISMPSEDYERFRKIVSVGKCSFDFKCFEDDKSHIYAFGKICDKDTILIEDKRFSEELGVSIDVFPLDALPKDLIKAKKYVAKCHLLTWFQKITIEKDFKNSKKRRHL